MDAPRNPERWPRGEETIPYLQVVLAKIIVDSICRLFQQINGERSRMSRSMRPVHTATNLKGVACWCCHIQLSSPLCTGIIHLWSLFQRHCWNNLQYHVTYSGFGSLTPSSSPLCAGIIHGQVILSEIICYYWNGPMTSIPWLVDHTHGDLFQSNGKLTNSCMVRLNLTVYRSQFILT